MSVFVENKNNRKVANHRNLITVNDLIVEKKSVLIIEDEPTQLRVLQNHLEELGYNVIAAANGKEGMQLWQEQEKPRIVITDLHMPEIDGFEVIQTIRGQENEYTYIMVLSNSGQKDSLLKALALGADDFAQKPVIQEELSLRLKSAKRLLRLEDHDKLVASLANFAAGRSGELDVHLQRTKEYCRLIAEDLSKNNPELGITADIVDDLANISVMHDLGKLGIPDNILNKKGEYTPEERKLFESHTTRGAEIFKNLCKNTRSRFLKLGHEIVLNHHEMWDGSGYPQGLKEKEIPLSARIMALVDVYDEIRSRKPYKDPFPASYAEVTIIKSKDGCFDPVVVEAFIRTKDKFVEIHDKYPDM